MISFARLPVCVPFPAAGRSFSLQPGAAAGVLRRVRHHGGCAGAAPHVRHALHAAAAGADDAGVGCYPQTLLVSLPLPQKSRLPAAAAVLAGTPLLLPHPSATWLSCGCCCNPSAILELGVCEGQVRCGLGVGACSMLQRACSCPTMTLICSTFLSTAVISCQLRCKAVLYKSLIKN